MPTLSLTFPAGSYPSAVTMTALARTDTAASVTFTGAFTGAGATWSNTWTAPAESLTYRWYATAVIGGVTTPLDGTLVDANTGEGPDFVGRYTGESLCRTFLGTILKAVLGDTDADDVEDSGAWQLSVVTAEALVDLMTNGPHAVTPGTPKASVFERWARVLACFEAYVRRGINDDKVGGDFRLLRDDVMMEMKAFRTGELNMPGDDADDGVGDDSLTYLRTLAPASARPACGTVRPVCCDPFDRRL